MQLKAKICGNTHFVTIGLHEAKGEMLQRFAAKTYYKEFLDPPLEFTHAEGHGLTGSDLEKGEPINSKS